PDASAIVLKRLKADDLAVRAAPASAIGDLKSPGGDQALADAYRLGQRVAMYAARAAALAALRQYGAAAALPVLQTALADKDWTIRIRAAGLIKQLDPNRIGGDIDAAIRPAPTTVPAETYQAPRLVTPPVSTQAYVAIDRRTIQIELAVIAAPLTLQNFISLARTGF